MILPSIRTLTLYKNSNEQRCGVQDFMLDWMLKEAQRLEIPKHGYCGGLMFDEMSLQVSCVELLTAGYLTVNYCINLCYF